MVSTLFRRGAPQKKGMNMFGKISRMIGRRAFWMPLPFLFIAPLLAQTGVRPELPQGDGRDMMAMVCTQCHSLKPITLWRAGVSGWKNEVDEMALRGARMTPSEAEVIVRYLSQNFGPGSRLSVGGSANSAVSLPTAPGKDLVETRCSLCHDLNRVVMQRKSRPEWEQVTKDMLARGAQATPQQIQDIVSYLSDQFGRVAPAAPPAH